MQKRLQSLPLLKIEGAAGMNKGTAQTSGQKSAPETLHTTAAKLPLGRRTKNLAAAGVLVLGAVFIVLGIMRGEQRIVLQKAIRICLECIGIG